MPGAEAAGVRRARHALVRRVLAPITQAAYEADGTLRPNALLNGILVVRWAVLAWLALLVASGVTEIGQPVLAWGALALTAAWTAWVTLGQPRWSPAMLAGDLVVAAILLLVAALDPGLATIYPVTAALTWGARLGFRGGSLSGLLLGSVYVVASAVGGLVLDVVDEQLFNVLGDALGLVLAGGGIGLVSTLIRRSNLALQAAQADRLRAREEAARLAEREELGRRIHDSVLQVLSLVHKRARELAGPEPGTRPELTRLADLAAQQEMALRDLLLGRATAGLGEPDIGPGEPDIGPGQLVGPGELVDPSGPGAPVGLRGLLEDLARRRGADLDVQVSSVGEPILPAATAHELGAAVDQALGNVVRHAGTRSAWLLAEARDGEVVVSVRDDGRGFRYDEAALLASGRLGLRHSIRGRIEQLGGRVAVESAPGRGTEVELRVPTVGEEPGAPGEARRRSTGPAREQTGRRARGPTGGRTRGQARGRTRGRSGDG